MRRSSSLQDRCSFGVPIIIKLHTMRASTRIDDLIAEARACVEEGEDPEEVLEEYFGLEPDYVFDLLEGMF